MFTYKFIHIRTNIDIDDMLLAKAQQLTKIRTKKAIVEKALRLLVQLEGQKELSVYWGKIQLDEKAFE
ncbi:type II toxin-antitoxin system VapB family antitoxin [Mucilaginibacter frigoritolerans]|nr:type II toxin-antitoxin system VapB family antitoxin [Mucilaginibacter frigoritolerans]